MSVAATFTTPVGRLVQGSLYVPQMKDIDGNEKLDKNGEPQGTFYFALAIPKGKESHWNQTEWGKIIWDVGQKAFPSGAANSPSFHWKIKDGDSDIPNKKGKKPCDQEGHPRHWILSLSSTFGPTIYNENGSIVWPEPERVKPGFFIQVNMSVNGNNSQQSPGVYLNHKMVSFQAYGEVIQFGADPKACGFGASPLPAGASRTPVSGGFNPQPAGVDELPADFGVAPVMAAPVQMPPVPYTDILNPMAPPLPPVAAHRMTAKAQGNSYESLIKAGWTDQTLFQEGLME
jgi:hypothetical protein